VVRLQFCGLHTNSTSRRRISNLAVHNLQGIEARSFILIGCVEFWKDLVKAIVDQVFDARLFEAGVVA
jgi:hypothetical protein